MRSLEERLEAAPESLTTTTATGPERSPSKPPRYRQGAMSGEPRRARRDRSAAAPGGRASPSPPPPRRHPGQRSPSPVAKPSQVSASTPLPAAEATSGEAVRPRADAAMCVDGLEPTPRRAHDRSATAPDGHASPSPPPPRRDPCRSSPSPAARTSVSTPQPAAEATSARDAMRTRAEAAPCAGRTSPAIT